VQTLYKLPSSTSKSFKSCFTPPKSKKTKPKMRVVYLLQALQAFTTVTAAVLPDEAVDTNNTDISLLDDATPANLEIRATFAAAAILGKLSQDLILSTVASVFAGQFLNAVGGSSNVVQLSEQTIGRIANLVKTSIEDAWYDRDKADSRTFLQVASNYDRRGRYNLTHPEPSQFGIIDQDRELAHDSASEAQGLLNRIALYGLKGAPLYQVLLGTWVSFRREQIVLSQMLDDINQGTTTLAATARRSFRSDCKAMHDALVKYRNEYDRTIPRLYFDVKESSRQVSSHLISCRQTVERWVSVRAYKQAMYSDAERAAVSVRDLDLDYFRIFGTCRMNRCNPSAAGTACFTEKREWADAWHRASLEDWRVKKRGDFLTDHIDRNIDSLMSLHNGTLPV